MFRRMIFAGAFLVILALICCTSPQNDDFDFANDPTDFSGANNQEIFSTSTDTIGAQTAFNSDLWRPLTTFANYDTDLLEIGQARMCRISTATNLAKVIVPVWNVSTDKALPFIYASNAKIKGAGGETLANVSGFVFGSVGTVGSSAQSSTCLAPGEQGFFLFVDSNANFVNSSWLEMDVDFMKERVEDPVTEVLPISFYHQHDGSYDQLDSTIKNTGASDAVLDASQTLYFLIDGDGSTIGWGFFNVFLSDSSLNPGETYATSVSTIFEGAVNTVRVRTDFVDYNYSSLNYAKEVDIINYLHRRNHIEVNKAITLSNSK